MGRLAGDATAMMSLPTVMDALLAKGHVVDVALAFIGLEFAFLWLRAPASARWDKARALLLALGPGACLMLALRVALTGGDARWVAFWLTASLPLHLADLMRRKW